MSRPLTRRVVLPLSLLAVVLMSGCATDFTGIGGTDSHKCPMPEGGACQSIIENYHASSMPATTPRTATAADEIRPRIVTLTPGFGDNLDGAPLMTTPRVLRVYVTPWRDSDDNLMEGRRVYTRIDEGRWRIEHFDASVKSSVQPKLHHSTSEAEGVKQSAGAASPSQASSIAAAVSSLANSAKQKADFFGNIIGTGAESGMPAQLTDGPSPVLPFRSDDSQGEPW
ncbi:MAG: TraV family lipoprotein [Azonexus sp.]|nr:TraV family lipoprotein [Azonexus sp.]